MSSTLVLRNNFTPFRIVTWRKAVEQWYKGSAEIIAEYPDEIRSSSFAMKRPAVIRLLKKYKEQTRAIKFNKRNIWLRDNQKCAYCLVHLPLHNVTFDHFPIPKSKGGKTNWDNIVSSCSKCNQKRGNRAPELSGMKCHIVPHKPKELPNNYRLFYTPEMPEEWMPYLPVK